MKCRSLRGRRVIRDKSVIPIIPLTKIKQMGIMGITRHRSVCKFSARTSGRAFCFAKQGELNGTRGINE